jgi:hypothetical protein
MVPQDSKECRVAALDSDLLLTQMNLSNHFTEAAKVIPYSDQAFQDALIQWLVQTNQV